MKSYWWFLLHVKVAASESPTQLNFNNCETIHCCFYETSRDGKSQVRRCLRHAGDFIGLKLNERNSAEFELKYFGFQSCIIQLNFISSLANIFTARLAISISLISPTFILLYHNFPIVRPQFSFKIIKHRIFFFEKSHYKVCRVSNWLIVCTSLKDNNSD